MMVRKCFFSTMVTMKRIVLSASFWAACAGLAAMELLNLLQELSLISGGVTSVLYLYEVGTYSNFWVLYLLFAAIPSATLFCADWENRYIRPCILRSSKKCYAVATAIACYLAAFLVVLIGDSVFLLLLHSRYPWILPENIEGLGIADSVYSPLMSGAGVYLYFLIRTLCKAFCAAFTSVLALCLSTVITNIFVTLAAPVIVFYIFENLLILLEMPASFQIGSIAKGHIAVGGLGTTVLYTAVLFTLCAAVFGQLFVSSVQRRVENG